LAGKELLPALAVVGNNKPINWGNKFILITLGTLANFRRISAFIRENLRPKDF
jgi:hypothetical protein